LKEFWDSKKFTKIL